MTVLRGVYKEGAVHLHEPLALPDNTEVDVSISPVNGQENAQSERERIHTLFLAAGLILPHSQTQAEPQLSPEREVQLAEKLAKTGSLSDLINKERDEQDDGLLL